MFRVWISNKDAEIRSKILTKLGMDSKLPLQKKKKKSQNTVNLKLDTARIEERDISQIHISDHLKKSINIFQLTVKK